jgi:pathogenesis-related protein 1
MSHFILTCQRLGLLLVMTLAPTCVTGYRPLPTPVSTTPPVKISRTLTLPFELDGEAVYVSQHGTWREAILTGYKWTSNKGFYYNVSYQPDNSPEANVSLDRIITLATAQQRNIAVNVYDLATPTGVQQMLDSHNKWRKDIGLPPLVWSAELAKFSQEWANKLIATNQFKHYPNNNYGENLIFSQGKRMSPSSVVKLWGDEGRDYNPQTNSCKPGGMCGHYTQLVWRNTKQVGCAMAKSGNKEVWACNYDPPGNYIGEKPY